MRQIKTIVVHHSASPRDATSVERVRLWHMRDRGWDDIGYHYVVTRDGLRLGRPVHKVGAHCYGHNASSVGVCVLGDYTREPMDLWSWSTLVSVVCDLLDQYGLTVDDVEGHGGMKGAATECPGFDVDQLREDVAHEIQQRRSRADDARRRDK